MNTPYHKFGRLVFKTRHQKGFSQDELGKLCGISQMTIHRVEKGQSHRLRFSSVVSVGQALGLSLGNIFTELGV